MDNQLIVFHIECRLPVDVDQVKPCEMLSQAIKSSTNQTNKSQSNFTFYQSSSSLSSSSTQINNNNSSSSSDQLYQQKHIWQHFPSSNQNQDHRSQQFHRYQYPAPETQSSTISIFSLIKNQRNPTINRLTKLLQPNLRPSMNFLLLTILILNLINRVPCTLAINNPSPGTSEINQHASSTINNNLITNPYDIINLNNNNVDDKEINSNSNSLGNLEDDFSLSSLTHSRPILLSPSSELLESSSSTLLSQSKSYSPSSSQLSSSSSSQSSSLSSPLSSSTNQSPKSSSSSLSSSIETTSSPVSPDSYYSLISSHHPSQLSHYYLQINKPQQSPPTTSSPPPSQQQSTYNNNNNDANELNIKTAKDFESLFHRIARRSSRPYDVPQIECPASEDGVDRFACPTPNKEGRYRCIEDHELCNGFIACPNAEDEDRKLCMFYKTTKAHLDVLADAMLRMVRGRF